MNQRDEPMDLQTLVEGGSSPWCESTSEGERCDLPAGHTGTHKRYSRRMPGIERRWPIMKPAEFIPEPEPVEVDERMPAAWHLEQAEAHLRAADRLAQTDPNLATARLLAASASASIAAAGLLAELFPLAVQAAADLEKARAAAAVIEQRTRQVKWP